MFMVTGFPLSFDFISIFAIVIRVYTNALYTCVQDADRISYIRDGFSDSFTRKPVDVKGTLENSFTILR